MYKIFVEDNGERKFFKKTQVRDQMKNYFALLLKLIVYIIRLKISLLLIIVITQNYYLVI